MIHNEHTQKTRINKQHIQKIMFPGSAYRKEISQQYTPATHRAAVHCQRVLLGSSILISDHRRLPDSPWGNVAKPLVSPLTPVPLSKWISLMSFMSWLKEFSVTDTDNGCWQVHETCKIAKTTFTWCIQNTVVQINHYFECLKNPAQNPNSSVNPNVTSIYDPDTSSKN